MSEHNSLIKLDEVRQTLAELRSVDDVKDIRDKAEAMRVYAQQAKLGLESQNHAAEIKLRAERRAGELLRDIERSRGARVDQTSSIDGMRSLTPYQTALETAQISHTAAHNWQRIANLPEPDFESIIEDTKAKGEELTTTAMVRAARKYDPAPDSALTPTYPTETYRCIVIDPPWPVVKIDRDVRPQQQHHLDYPVMSLEDIAALPIRELAAQDGCHLYLWVTQKYLPAGLDLMEQWGFNYQCVLTWVKPTGMTPYHFMYNTEHILFGACGGLRLQQYGLKLAFDAPVNGHSTKPEVFYERVLLASPEPRLEMFARRARDGFEVWGNEV